MNTVGPSSAKSRFRSEPLSFALGLAQHLTALSSAITEIHVEKSAGGLKLALDTGDNSAVLWLDESTDHQLGITRERAYEEISWIKTPFDYGLLSAATKIYNDLLEDFKPVTPEPTA